MNTELWKPVKGKEEYAEVSNYGQIHKFKREYYSGRNHQIKKIIEEEWTYGRENENGYFMTSIGGITKGVHVWVYMTFNDCDIPKGYDVNHIDENKHCNCVWNLNLMTHGDNMRWGTHGAKISAALRGKKQSAETIEKRAAAQRGKPKPKVSAALKGKPNPKTAATNKNNPKKSKAVQALDPTTLEVVMEFPSTQEAQRQYGFSSGAVSRCCRNCYSTHKGNVYKGYIWRFRAI